MNMNNESNNQNFNGGMENLSNGNNMMNQNGMPNPNPIPNNQGFNTPNPNMIPNPTPMPEQNMGTGNTNIPNPMPIPPAGENINLEPAGMVPQTPQQVNNNVAQPLEATSLNAQTVMNPAPNQMGMMDQNNMGTMNSANPNMMNNTPTGAPNPNNNIGMMGGIPVPPPIPEEPKNKGKKKPINTPLLIILIVVLIAAIGYGVYYFLTTSKSASNTVTVTPTLSELELGAEIGTGAEFYGRISPSSAASSCTVDTDLDTSKVGTYEYTITCDGKTTEPHIIEVKDTTAPEVEVKEVIVTPGTTVEADDFIESAIDESDVTFTFEEEIDTSVEGEYEVNIIASDEYENTTTVVGSLIVDANAPQIFMYCNRDETTEQPATAYSEYRFGIDNQGLFYNGQKTITYEFETEADYLAAVETIETDGSLDGYEGRVYVDDDSYLITITIDMSETDLATDFNLDTFPTGEGDIEGLFDSPCEYGDE